MPQATAIKAIGGFGYRKTAELVVQRFVAFMKTGSASWASGLLELRGYQAMAIGTLAVSLRKEQIMDYWLLVETVRDIVRHLKLEVMIEVDFESG